MSREGGPGFVVIGNFLIFENGRERSVVRWKTDVGYWFVSHVSRTGLPV